MSLGNLRTDLNGYVPGGAKEMNFLAPQLSLLGCSVTIQAQAVNDSQMGFGIPAPFSESEQQSLENRGHKGLYLGSREEKEARNARTGLFARGHWRPAEDAKLKELVSQYGPENWNLIAEHLEGRSGKSCRLRWFNQLDPRINRRALTEEEGERLLSAHRLYGNRWAMIARLFPGRTDNAMKNHWHVIMARRNRERSSTIYRRRKPSLPSPDSPTSEVLETQVMTPQKLKITINNNCSESSTNSSSGNESASTCTDLSLSPSYATVQSFSFQQPHQIDSSKVSSRGNWLYRQHGAVGIGVERNEQDFSVEESVGRYERTNRSISMESEVMSEKIQTPFIDFLGVGAC